MKRIAYVAVALLCTAAFYNSSALGEGLKPTFTRTGIRPLPTQSLKAPPIYTGVQRAAALAKVMSLSVPPALGSPFSVTPGKPVAPNAGGLIMTDVQAFDGNHNNPEGTVIFRNSTAASFVLEIHTQPGKRYAIDCRTLAPRVFYSYSVGNTPVSGEAQADGNYHVVFATSAMPSDAWVLISAYLATETFTPKVPALSFYGCEVSPF